MKVIDDKRIRDLIHSIKLPYYIVLFAIITLISLSFSIYLLSTIPHIAFVHNDRLLTEYMGVKEATKEYQHKLNNWQANIDTLQNELNREIKEYKTNSVKLNKQQKKHREEYLRKRQQELLNYKRSIELKAREEENIMSAEVLNQINNFVMEYGKANGYDYIFGVTENGSMLYGREMDDITDEIIQALNDTYIGK